MMQHVAPDCRTPCARQPAFLAPSTVLQMFERHRQKAARHLLAGNAEAVWAQIVRQVPEFERNQDFSNVPPVYRPLVEAKITSWRGHRLFGLEPEFPNNWEDLRGQDPIISIASDALLGTQSEHNYGFSVWLNREQMAGGHHEGGQLIHHCAV